MNSHRLGCWCVAHPLPTAAALAERSRCPLLRIVSARPSPSGGSHLARPALPPAPSRCRLFGGIALGATPGAEAASAAALPVGSVEVGLPLPFPGSDDGTGHWAVHLIVNAAACANAPSCTDSRRRACLRVQEAKYSVLKAAEDGDLAALERLLGENPALVDCVNVVRGPSTACRSPPLTAAREPCCSSHASVL